MALSTAAATYGSAPSQAAAGRPRRRWLTRAPAAGAIDGWCGRSASSISAVSSAVAASTAVVSIVHDSGTIPRVETVP